MKKEKKLTNTSKASDDDKIKELTGTLQMLQADFENYRKRVEKEKEEFKEYAKIETISRFLPIMDNFKLALKHAKEDTEFTKGIKLIFSQMASELESLGVKKIEGMGKPFDPKFHEALMADYSDQPKDMIIEEFQTGYILGERIIRHSKVKISKGKKEEEQ